MEERDFLNDVMAGYELPDNVPTQVEADTTQFYQLPAGHYEGFFGKLNPKFTKLDPATGKSKGCKADEDGAVFDHFTASIWLTKYLGNSQSVQEKNLIQYDGKKLIVPSNPTPELYYPFFISTKPDDQWKYKNVFQDWKIEGVPSVFSPAPNNPAKTVTNIKALMYYYGVGVSFHLSFKSGGKEFRFIDGKLGLRKSGNTIVRIPFEALKEFEETINAKVEAERKLRESQRQANKDNISQPSPETDFNAMADGQGFDEFLDR